MKRDRILHLGSLIRLRPDYEDRYIILHEHPFPGVLDSIRKANIRNYSIFLRDGVLFSYLEYCGGDFAADMTRIADDCTRKWWKLTDPMQEPLADRKEDEWWATMDLICHEPGAAEPPAKAVRRAFAAGAEDPAVDCSGMLRELLIAGFQNLSVFRRDRNLYLYMEHEGVAQEEDRAQLPELPARVLAPGLLEMRQVFHTPGAASPKKVMVTGCFDMLHSGHVAFLHEASSFGELHVCIGSDENVRRLKGACPVTSQEERRYMLTALRCVKDCRVNSGFGIMDFLRELDDIHPDVFVVNEDGNTPAKAELCRERRIAYRVLVRKPHGDLPPRSTTALKTECRIPFRIDLAGGWLDQPYVSRFHAGPVLTIAIEPVIEFNDRSGMASSTRRKAMELWKTDVPHGDQEHLAKLLFAYENPPGTNEISGSQDALGIVFPGLNKFHYDNHYWPASLESVHQEEILGWLENSLYLVTLEPRVAGFNVLDNTNITPEGARDLAAAAEACWCAILSRNMDEFGNSFRRSFEAQVAMFPNMVDDEIRRIIRRYENRAKGWKLSGAGGGGYLILVSDAPIPGTVTIRIRRRESL